MSSTTQTTTQTEATLTLRADGSKGDDTYKYSHLLPYFSKDTYPPLSPFQHVDPALRALEHPDPRSFLNSAISVVELTPNLGTEVRGVSLKDLDSNGRDQLALEVNNLLHSDHSATLKCVERQVARRGLMVFRDQSDFIDQGPEAYLAWGRHFGRFVRLGSPFSCYPPHDVYWADYTFTLLQAIRRTTRRSIWYTSQFSYDRYSHSV